jgi:serine/threonine protein kinase
LGVVVWRPSTSYNLRQKREVALKVLDTEVGATLRLDRFQREIDLVAVLVHPHIVPVFDSGNTAGRLWYVMPYIRGESLRARLEREGMLPISDALRITQEVAEALDYTHRQAWCIATSSLRTSCSRKGRPSWATLALPGSRKSARLPRGIACPVLCPFSGEGWDSGPY